MAMLTMRPQRLIQVGFEFINQYIGDGAKKSVNGVGVSHFQPIKPSERLLMQAKEGTGCEAKWRSAREGVVKYFHWKCHSTGVLEKHFGI